MANNSTVFVDFVTPVIAAWLNDVNNTTYNLSLDTGTANTYAITLASTFASPINGTVVRFKALNTNTGASTLNVTGSSNFGAVTLRGTAGALQGGEIVAGGNYTCLFSDSLGAWVIIAQTAGNQQVVTATSSNQAATFGQVTALTNALTGFQSISSSVASNALTATLNAPATLQFRNPTLTSGVPVSNSIAANLSITVPSGATLGMTSGVGGFLILLVAYNAGVPVLCITNLSGAPNLDETTLISPTTISGGATTAGVIYSASAVATNSPFRVVGLLNVAETTAGVWALAPSTVQGIGGQAMAALSSVGFGQTYQNVAGSRATGTSFFNTTSKEITVVVSLGSSSLSSLSAVVNGSTITNFTIPAGGVSELTFPVPPGASYAVSGGTSISSWFEKR